MGLNNTRRGWLAAAAPVFGSLATACFSSRAAAQPQVGPPDVLPHIKPEETRLPNGRKQSDEILKAEHKRNLDDARELADMTRSLQEELEKEDRFVLSLGTLKKLDDIEKLTKRIRSRLKH